MSEQFSNPSVPNPMGLTVHDTGKGVTGNTSDAGLRPHAAPVDARPTEGLASARNEMGVPAVAGAVGPNDLVTFAGQTMKASLAAQLGFLTMQGGSYVEAHSAKEAGAQAQPPFRRG